MKQKKLSYNQSVELVLTHLKATKDQWNLEDNALRRKHYIFYIVEGNPKYNSIDCCPVSSLGNKSLGRFNEVGRVFKLHPKAVEHIVSAADNSLDDLRAWNKRKVNADCLYPKAVMDIRRQMDRIIRR